MDNLFFDDWQSFGRVFIMTILAYIAMIFSLRISGKRTLSKMNAFDFIITVALGSSLATVALNKSIPLANGALYFITWLSVRVSKVKNIVTSQPSLLMYRGKLIDDKLKKERITIEEIYLTAREKGITDLKDVDIIVLETTGDITIIPKAPSIEAETLNDVEKPDYSIP